MPPRSRISIGSSFAATRRSLQSPRPERPTPAGTSADASTRYRRTTLRAQQLKALRANLDRIKTLPADLDEALSRVTDAQTNASAASLAKAATSLSVARLTKLVAAYGDPSQQLLLLSAFAPKEPPINP
jgi:hypothetical protein